MSRINTWSWPLAAALAVLLGGQLLGAPVVAQQPACQGMDVAPPGVSERAASRPCGTVAGLAGVIEGSSSFGDVNNDGDLDLVITGSGTATLYLGDGQGGFSPANAELTGVGFGSTSAFGDVNEDGALDLVITGDTGARRDPSPSATLYIGDGQGAFAATDAGLLGVRYGASAFGDVNGDGNLDLLITGTSGSNEGTARLYVGDGQGGFTTVDTEITGVAHGSISLSDLNADGHPDVLVTGSRYNEPTTTLYFGNQKGRFTAADAALEGVRQSSSAGGDLNNDGRRDLVITGRPTNYSQTAIVYLATGTRQFKRIDAGLTGVYAGSSSIGDVDSDGNLDVLLTGMGERRRPRAVLYLGDGQGGFVEAEAGLRGVGRSSSAFGDVNGDGTLDLVITGSPLTGRTATLYLGSADGGFTPAGQ